MQTCAPFLRGVPSWDSMLTPSLLRSKRSLARVRARGWLHHSVLAAKPVSWAPGYRNPVRLPKG